MIKITKHVFVAIIVMFATWVFLVGSFPIFDGFYSNLSLSMVIMGVSIFILYISYLKTEKNWIFNLMIFTSLFYYVILVLKAL